MKFPVKIANCIACIAIGLLLSLNLRAAELALNNNPYQPIVARNVFGLNPPTPADAQPAPTPPSKITPNGIQNFFGQVQVLFKVAGTAKPGVPAKDKFYMLSQGQREDDIEVTLIDEQKGMITFNNHGVVEQLPLVEPKSESHGPSPANGPSNLKAPRPGMNNFNREHPFSRFGQPGSFNRNNNSQDNNANNGNNGFNGGNGRTYQPPQSNMTAAQAAIIMENNRGNYLNSGNSAMANLIPPTPLTRLLKGQSASAPPAP